MRASQHIPPSNSYRMTPVQRRLSAGFDGPSGMRTVARRSTMPAARKVEIAAAVTGGALIISLIISLMAI